MRGLLIVMTTVILATAAAEATVRSPKSTLIIERGVETGFSPKPTARVLLGVRSDNLFERQEALSTCGYYNGWLTIEMKSAVPAKMK